MKQLIDFAKGCTEALFSRAPQDARTSQTTKEPEEHTTSDTESESRDAEVISLAVYHLRKRNKQYPRE